MFLPVPRLFLYEPRIRAKHVITLGTVRPSYNAVCYNTKSDITRSDLGLRIVESTTGHFHAKWHEIRHWPINYFELNYYVFITKTDTQTNTFSRTLICENAPMNFHLLVRIFATFMHYFWPMNVTNRTWLLLFAQFCRNILVSAQTLK